MSMARKIFAFYNHSTCTLHLAFGNFYSLYPLDSSICNYYFYILFCDMQSNNFSSCFHFCYKHGHTSLEKILLTKWYAIQLVKCNITKYSKHRWETANVINMQRQNQQLKVAYHVPDGRGHLCKLSAPVCCYWRNIHTPVQRVQPLGVNRVQVHPDVVFQIITKNMYNQQNKTSLILEKHF